MLFLGDDDVMLRIVEVEAPDNESAVNVAIGKIEELAIDIDAVKSVHCALQSEWESYLNSHNEEGCDGCCEGCCHKEEDR